MLDITRSNRYQVQAQVNKVESDFVQSARDNIGEVYDHLRFPSDLELLEFIHSHLPENKYLLPVAVCGDGGVPGPNPTQRESNAANEWPASTLLLAKAVPQFIYIKCYHWVNNRGKYAG
jgi:hypothetical protein